MIELRFRRDLYADDAVEAAVEAFRPHATVESERRDEHVLVRVHAPDGAEASVEPSLAGELANWALGATVDAGRARGAS
jgi:hypothetical protein